GPTSVPGRLAGVLDPAARRQHDLGDRSPLTLRVQPLTGPPLPPSFAKQVTLLTIRGGPMGRRRSLAVISAFVMAAGVLLPASGASAHDDDHARHGFQKVGYFTQWGIYGR